jgi:hypothetical protein
VRQKTSAGLGGASAVSNGGIFTAGVQAMTRFAGLAMAAVVGLMIGQSTAWAAPHRAAHPVAHPPKKAPPKHPAGKTPPHPAQHNKMKGTAKEAHKNGAAGPEHSAHPADKPKETHHEVHKPDASAADSKRHDQHEDVHHHRHGPGVGVNGVTVDGGDGGVVVDGGAAAVPAGDVAPVGTSLPGRPQIHFSVSDSERDTYGAAARAAGMNRSEWIRTRLNAAVSRELK